MDAAAVGDFSATKEFLALGVMALEQSVFDAGDWSLAYVFLALVEDPPSNLFSERMNTLSAAGRPFSPLVSPGLASTNLGYIKELELLSIRRTDTRRLAPTFFPIPVPDASAYDRMPTRPSQKRRRSVFLSRAVHVISMAMNFWFFGGGFQSAEGLWRRPNAMHRKFYGHVKSLIRSDGLDVTFDALRSGRELYARLFDLVESFQFGGASANPYDRSFQGFEVPRDESLYPELEPYRDLDPSRLRLSGTGSWDISSFLSENLLMAYKEPLVLKLDREPEPWEFPRLRDDQKTIFDLAKLWDSQGLLYLHQEEVEERKDFELVRIFNCYKNELVDRQIGDRRGRNTIEAVVKGPSSNLPSGSDLCDLVVDPKRQRLSISISDRKDYYHQIKISKRRAICNTLGPGLPLDWCEDLEAFNVFLLQAASKKRYDRLRDGDPELKDWLLMIFFSVSVEETSNNPEDAAAVHAYHTAQRAYEEAGLLGSPEKDKCGAEEGKTIGAFLNSAQRATSRGLCTVSAPPEKRLALSTISLQVAQLGATTCGLHSCIMGAWVSMIIYRRPMMSLFQHAFTLVSNEQAAERNNEVIHLPRAVAQELAMVFVLSPLMQTNLAADFGQKIYATDASEEKGAICSALANKDIQEVLFRTCRTKGAYTKLLSPTQVLLKRLNEFEEIGEETFQLPFVRPGRPLAFTFEFLEIYSGASDVTRYMDSLGIICGQPIELSRSEEFNMKFVHLLEWITYMLAEKVLKAVLLMPPCTTFSIMRRPALRDRFHPFGFNP
eukprot:s1882_g11.t1